MSSLSYSDFLKRKKRELVPVPFVLDPDLARELESEKLIEFQVSSQAAAFPTDKSIADDLRECRKRLAKIREDLKPHIDVWWFAAMEGDGWSDLETDPDYQPLGTDEEKRYYRDVLGIDGEPRWNVQTFPPAAVQATCVAILPAGEKLDPDAKLDPILSMEDVEHLWHGEDSPFNKADKAALFTAANNANNGRGWVQAGKDFALTPAGAPSPSGRSTKAGRPASSGAAPGPPPAKPSG